MWESLVTDVLIWQSAPLHVVHYERLVNNTDLYLRGMLHFLRVPEDEERLSCVSSHLAGPVKSVDKKAVDPFTSSEKMKIAKAVDRVNRLLLLLGYPVIASSQKT
ncbi:WSC domain-containing protein 1-like [Homarus americanus]|uniref:WSC domain-containing protein 1-like n=1 Tax=Homarus americanus TaxID=6706 RepID=UPI001C4856B3|nr:WSC domain-containing protein 1-like [Homarus americanus]